MMADTPNPGSDAQRVTPADIARLTPRQQDVLGEIAIGQDGGHHPATIKSLLAKGLIVRHDERQRGRGLYGGTLIIPRYTVPLPVHMAWAYWGSEQGPEEEE